MKVDDVIVLSVDEWKELRKQAFKTTCDTTQPKETLRYKLHVSTAHRRNVAEQRLN